MILTVTSFKGGVGKTTTAIHLAAAFHRRGRTLLIDSDPGANAIAWSSRGKLGFPVLGPAAATRELRARDYPTLIFDTKARPEPAELEDLAAGCDLLIVPTTPDFLGLGSLVPIRERLLDLPCRWRVLLTMVDRPEDAAVAKEELLKADFPVFEHSIRRSKAFSHAAGLGVTAGEAGSPTGRAGWRHYLRLSEEIEAMIEQEEVA